MYLFVDSSSLSNNVRTKNKSIEFPKSPNILNNISLIDDLGELSQ